MIEQMHENSLEAYKSLKLPKARKQVLAVIIHLEKATIEEVAIYLDKYPNQVSGRFTELCKAGIIKDSGAKKVRGRSCAVWSVV